MSVQGIIGKLKGDELLDGQNFGVGETKEVFDWCMSVEVKNKAVCNFLGGVLVGRGDINKGAIWFQEAANLGDGVSCYRLGKLWENAGYKDTALEWYLKGAQLGDIQAMYLLGLNASGKPKLIETAKEWYTKASNLGHRRSLHNLGILYYSLRDDVNAIECFLEEIRRDDDPNAMNLIGVIYYQKGDLKRAVGGLLLRGSCIRIRIRS